MIRSPKEASEKGGNGNGVYSVSRMFHRNSLRSLSLASVSDLTKAQIANYVAQYINNSSNNPQQNNNGTPTHYNGAARHHRNSVGHLSHNQAPFNVNGIDEIRSTPSFSMTS